ncbi:putative LRR receptor-like serine/threonine-protein kinase [Acorus gramineus]|uniref:LRR receptor-like serine/threonine-protein kinase n=1 Tax=Acorus gramineus TaxID=55184 RepID=A0AAV9BIQ9_ACOGR|nr:putative LRR receptor-like serine/threonine-protein kinase [Acorus gramineus]
MSVRSLLLLLFFFFFVSRGLSQQRLSSSSELLALYRLRGSLGLRSRDWPRKSDPCSAWRGVTCLGGRVVSLDLSRLRRTRLGKLDPRFAVDGLVNLTRLSSFVSSGFPLPGPVPPSLGPALPALSRLVLNGSFVSGSLPPSLAAAANLTVINLSRNSLTGSLPPPLGRLAALSVLDVSSNSLSGPVPAAVAGLGGLTVLNLSLNVLSGALPEDLGRSADLTIIDLANNSFSGVLPSRVWSLPSLRVLNVSFNNLTGNLSSLVSNSAANVSSKDAVLNVAYNQFYGPVTASGLGTVFARFGSVDLSGNYFEGDAPIAANVSIGGNCFRNASNQRSFQDCSTFYASKGLKFDGVLPPNATNPSNSGGGHHRRRLAFILGGTISGLMFILVVALILAFLLRRRGTSGGGQRDVGGSTAPSGSGPPPPNSVVVNLSLVGEAFKIEQLLRATEEFSESNLIKHGHSGDLFRGVLEGGAVVVIKRIDLSVVSKKDGYLAELELYGKASHARLAPFLGHCLDAENEKFLVYKYMPNGDLSNALFRKTSEEDEGLQSLDWITRLKIATGAAEALCYLHHECNPPLVHRDIQASSILLDDKFEVRLGSLSEACAQEGENHSNVITRFLRLSQTAEPSISGASTTSCAYDVYCLGKVLLELVTGKLGISASNDTSTNEWLDQVLSCINIYDKDLVTKILDPSLIVDEDLLEEVWAMAIVAKSCLNPRQAKRPLMRHILKALENPLKVVREENSGSARLRTTSSRGSWNAALFGSWRHSSSDIVSVYAHPREGSSLKQSGTAGSQGSGQGADVSSNSHKRPSKEVFPEPSLVSRDVEE